MKVTGKELLKKFNSVFYRVLNDGVFVKYFSSSIVLTLTGLFAGFFTYRVIDPIFLGIFSLFSVFETYATITRLGIINGLGRELPFLFGKGDSDKAENYASTALFYTGISNVILLCVIGFYLIVDNGQLIKNTDYFLTFLVVVVKILSSSYSSFLAVTFRTSESFNNLGRINYYLSVFRMLSIVFIVKFGFWGLLFRELGLSILEMSLLHLHKPLSVAPKFNLKSFVHLFKIGTPLFLFSYFNSFIETIPRLFLINYGDVKDLGLFSPILIIFNLVSMFPKTMSNYFYPKMAFRFGETLNKKEVWNMFLKNYLVSFFISVPLFFFTYFFADYFGFFFPKYKSIIPYLKYFSFAVLFIGYRTGNVVFSVLNSWKLNLINSLLYFIFSILSFYILHHFFDENLFVVTLSMVIVSFLMFFSTLFLSYLSVNLVD